MADNTWDLTIARSDAACGMTSDDLNETRRFEVAQTSACLTSLGGVRKTSKALVLGIIAMLTVASPVAAQIQNGDFETRLPRGSAAGAGVGDEDGTIDGATCFVDTSIPDTATFNGTGFFGGGDARYAPNPWTIQSTPDYHTTTTIYFDTIRVARADLGTAAFPGTPPFDLSPNGGCFQGFTSLSATSPQGISQTITIPAADVNRDLVYKYEYVEFTDPRSPRCTPNVEFRVNTTSPFAGTVVGIAPTIGQRNGPTREGEWVVLETNAFRPSDFGVPAAGGTLDIYLGVTANACVTTWGFVDGLKIVEAPVPPATMSNKHSLSK